MLEFLDPIQAGASKTEFLSALETAVEDRTSQLIAEATGAPCKPSVRGEPPAEPKRAEAPGRARRRAAV